MKLIMTLIALGLSAGALFAQSFSTITPDYNGGYSVWNSDGSFSTVRPDYNGGYYQWNSNGSFDTYRPNYNGGYLHWHSDSDDNSGYHHRFGNQ